jgi:hypothetical protein
MQIGVVTDAGDVQLADIGDAVQDQGVIDIQPSS